MITDCYQSRAEKTHKHALPTARLKCLNCAASPKPRPNSFHFAYCPKGESYMKNRMTTLMLLAAVVFCIVLSDQALAQITPESLPCPTCRFGMVGITRGQTARLNVVNVSDVQPGTCPLSDDVPPGPCR